MRNHRTSDRPRLQWLRPATTLLLTALLLISGPGLVSGNSFSVTGNNLVVQLGTYAATQKQCYFERIFHGQFSPRTVSFTNPTGKAVNFVLIETEQTIDFGGVSATLTSGTLGTSSSIAVQITTTPRTVLFQNNVDVKMFCTP